MYNFISREKRTYDCISGTKYYYPFTVPNIINNKNNCVFEFINQ